MSAARRDSSPPPPPPPINSDWDMVQRQNASFAARTMVSVNAGAKPAAAAVAPAPAAAAAAAKPNGAAAAAPSANGTGSGAQKDDKSDAKGESKALWPAKPEKKEDGKYSGVKAIVIDNGTAFTKAGFAGEDAPRTLFPSVVGRPRYNVDVDGSGRNSFVGREAQQKRASLALKNPIEHGVVTNWDDMEAMWDHIFQYELKVQPEEYHVLLTEAPLNPKANRERMMQIMFETFQVPAAYVALTGALSLYGNGQTTGFVLECGEGVTHTVPIFDGQVLHHQITRLDFAGRNVTELLMRLMNAREEETGYSFSTSVERDTIRRMKEATCYIVMDYEKELGRAKLSASNAAAIEKKFVLPDGKSITVGTERFTAAEGLFRPTLLHEEGDSEIKGVHEACYRCITKCDMTLRRYFLENIVLSGGSCLFPGFEERLAAEITKLMPQTGLVKVKVKRELNAQQLVWAGGSVLSSLSGFAPMWITREDYDEVGPSIVHIKCP